MGKTLPGILLLCSPLLFLSGCQNSPTTQAQTASSDRPIPVDAGIARLDSLTNARRFTGTTKPGKEVTLRARIEGQLVSLNVDRGDRVNRGQVVGQQDDVVLTANVLQAEAELAAREGELAQTQTLVANAQAQVERAQAEYAQAQADSRRLEQLATVGVVPAQQAEQARTRTKTALQTLRSAEALLQSQRAEIATVQKRIEAQRAILQQAQEKRSFTMLRSPIDGIVIDKLSEEGNLLQPGNGVVTIGDFSSVKVLVEVSELDRPRLAVGQRAVIRLDALPDQELTGQVSRISPAADPQSRLFPVEVGIDNPPKTIGGGLLARVEFVQPNDRAVVVPITALRAGGRQERKTQIFVIQRLGKDMTVKARPIVIGREQDGKVIVKSGLSEGEEYVIRSGRPLKDGDKVVLSALSERGERNDKRGN